MYSLRALASLIDCEVEHSKDMLSPRKALFMPTPQEQLRVYGCPHLFFPLQKLTIKKSKTMDAPSVQ